ncbi:MAG: hypothetical protein ACTS78_02900 [Arsenophonus sp. NC-WZS1-MAG3]
MVLFYCRLRKLRKKKNLHRQRFRCCLFYQDKQLIDKIKIKNCRVKIGAEISAKSKTHTL